MELGQANVGRYRWRVMISRAKLLAVLGATSLVGLVSLCVPSTPAEAKATYTSPYTLAQTYSAALRLIRVDNGFKINERDPDAAYLLFDYESHESGTRVTPGAIEMVPGRDQVTVLVKLPKMPRYHEEVMMNALKRKLVSDLWTTATQTRARAPCPQRRPRRRRRRRLTPLARFSSGPNAHTALDRSCPPPLR